MVGIAAVTISNAPAATAAVASEADKAEESQGTAVQADTSKLRGSGQAQGAQGSEESSEPAHIKQLREMIIATLNGEIMQATAQLLEALQKTGGSSAGGMVSTQA